ncbi:MAG: hypothetical protein ACYDEC_14725 [Bacteroidia bacterium]
MNSIVKLLIAVIKMPTIGDRVIRLQEIESKQTTSIFLPDG